MANASIALLSYIVLAVLAPLSLIGNGCVLIAILTNRALRKNDGLYLWIALSMADFSVALLMLPNIVYLIAGWKPDINYDAKLTLLSSLPAISEVKVNSILTVAIAFDRFSAFAWPVAYKLRRRGYYAIASAAVATIWGVTDAVVCYLTAPLVPKPGCGAGGCFMHEKFRYYWGVSDMLINAIVMVITVLVLIKIRTRRTIHQGSRDSITVQFQANQITVSVLLCSGICIFLPSTFAGLGELSGLAVFAALGPFVAVGLLACGVTNACIFIFQHTVIRNSVYEIGKRLKTSITKL
uniref:G-protein coupled receptors family 1 profile domain-containing protein n=1 Tax=Plectus sambesii TaxID=2011161 RepID=A0A914X6V2_9BILA